MPSTPTIRGNSEIQSRNPTRRITTGARSVPHRLANLEHLSQQPFLISGCYMRIKRRDEAYKDLPTHRLAEPSKERSGTNYHCRGMTALHSSASVWFGSFEFEGQEYEQIQGFAMGSPLSAGLVQLFMETLEADHYRNIEGNNVAWLRYVDDTLTLLLTRTNLQNRRRLNAIT